MAEYFVRVKGKDWEGTERTFDLEPFNETDEGRARELGWARACQVSPLPDSALLFKKSAKGEEEIARVF